MYGGEQREGIKLADIILLFIIMLPIYAVLIWTYFDPEESLLWGKRWMYEEEPELSEEAIRFAKIASIVGIVALTIIFFIPILLKLAGLY